MLAALQRQYEEEAASELSAAWSRFKSTRDASKENTQGADDNEV